MHTRDNPDSSQLPVLAVLPDVRSALEHAGSAVLVAPPGSGKTTRVPLALLDVQWRGDRRILMLEPRRLAARAAASWMAALLGEAVGQTVGYRVRAEARVGPATRIEVVTEGVLTRILQSDPSLDGVAAVLFDEFHERSVHADLGLALCLQARALLRPDLRLLVMSATLDARPVAALLGDAPVIEASGRSFPVETQFRALPLDGRIEPAAARSILGALDRFEGDLLVFLPGIAEIRRVQQLLTEQPLPATVDVIPLHGALRLDEQDRVIRPSPAGRRKVVLATAIAETSLTIEGVRVVIDAGLARVPRFSPRTGLTRLATVRVSKASAEQRRGRAGRLAPGHCLRLWTEAEHAALLERGVPEILETDLAPLVLELAMWGATADSLAWLDAPPSAALSQAHELLRELDALDDGNTITPHGRELALLGVHPRLAHMLLRSRDLRHTGLACDLAALLGERDILRGGQAMPDPDVRLRLRALEAMRHGMRVPADVDVVAARRVLHEARVLAHRLAVSEGGADVDDAGILLAFAYPDRAALRRSGARGRFLMRNGRGAMMDPAWTLAGEELIVAAVVDGNGRESRITLAAPLARAALETHFAHQIEDAERVSWDDRTQSVRAVRRRTLDSLVLSESVVADADADLVARTLVDAIRRQGLTSLPWSPAARGLVERIRFLRTLDPAWPDASDAALLDTIDDWLLPHLTGMRKLEDLRRLDLAAALADWLGRARRKELDALAPTHVEVPTGSRLPIDYGDPHAPALAVRLQEMFGLVEGPRIVNGRVPLTLHLLSPAHRPVQVTRDLAGFWKGSWHAVRKELRGRYPKHFWPEDPATAQPTRRVRPRP